MLAWTTFSWWGLIEGVVFIRMDFRGLMLRGLESHELESKLELVLEYLALETLMGGSSITLMGNGWSELET